MVEQQPKTTHVATTPNKKPVPRIDVLKGDLVKDIKKFSVYYEGNRDKANRFILAGIEYVRRVPKLLECNRDSLGMALLQSAYFNFMPSGVSGEAYIIPYGTEAKFQIGYQGIVTLLYRTGKVASIKAIIVYENEKFDYSEGLHTTLMHTPTKFGEKRGEPVGVYTVANMTNGGQMFKVMSKEEIMAIKELSKAKAAKDSPWNSDKDPELWMWKKTCLIQLAKLLPKSIELTKAIEEDYKGEGMAKFDQDASGPGAGAASHEPEIPAEEKPKVTEAEFTEEEKHEIKNKERKEAGLPEIEYPEGGEDDEDVDGE